MVLKYTRDGDQHWKAEIVGTAGTPSDPIIIPGWVTRLSVVAIPGGGGTATVQYTVDPEVDVDNAPGSADWVDWDAGDVSAPAGYPARSSITAVRIVATTADATLKVAGHRSQIRIR